MVSYTKISIGALILMVSISIIYIQLNDKVRFRVDEDKSTFYVKDSRWLVSGREYNRLFGGTTQLYRDASNIKINKKINGSLVTIIRVTPYKRGPTIIDTYSFDGTQTDVELFPISHKVEIINGSGYLYRYTVDDLVDTGVKRKLTKQIVLSFGRNMKVELHPGYRWAWIGWPYGSDSLSAQYNIPTDNEVFYVRLFDPETEQILLAEDDGGDSSSIGGLGAQANNSALSTGGWSYSFGDGTSNKYLVNGTVGNQTIFCSSSIAVGTSQFYYPINCDHCSVNFEYFDDGFHLGYSMMGVHNKTTGSEHISVGLSVNPSATHYSVNVAGATTATDVAVGAGWHTMNISYAGWVGSSNLVTVWIDGIAVKNVTSSYNFTQVSGWCSDSGGIYQNLYVDNITVINQNFSSGNLSLLLDGLNDSRKYEYRSLVNVTANSSKGFVYIDIDAPGYGVNYQSGENVSFLFNITTLRITKFLNNKNSSVTQNSTNITIDNRTDLLSGTVNVSSVCVSGICPVNLIIMNENVTIAILPGRLNLTNLTHTEFIYRDTKTNETNITFTTAETIVININMSASGDTFYNLTFKIDGFDVDALNKANYTEYFNDTDDTSSLVSYNNVSGVSIIGEYDNFETNITDRWTEDNNGFITTGLTSGLDDNYWQFDFLCTNCIPEVTYDVLNDGDSEFDLGNYTLINIEYNGYQYAACWSSSNARSLTTFYITDGTSNIDMAQYGLLSLGGCGGSGSSSSVTTNTNITFKKVDDETWDVYEDDVFITQKSLSALDNSQHWYLKMNGVCIHTSFEIHCTNNNKVYRIQGSGLWLNKSRTGTNFTQNGSMCFDVVANTSIENNYTAVWISGKEYKPDGTNVYYYITADNHTTTQAATNDARNVFFTQGNQLSGCVNLSGTNETSPILYSLEFQVIPAAITDVVVDGGSDGVIDWNYSGVLNSTTSPQTVIISSDSINDYAQDFSKSQSFLFPVSISTGSEGILQIRNLLVNQDPNPINLNTSVMENCQECEINASFTQGLITFEKLALDFLGSWNYTVLAHTYNYGINVSHLVMVKYSKHNCTMPKGVEYYEPTLMSNNDKNVTVLGQEFNRCNSSLDTYCKSTSIPIFNCTYLGYDENRTNVTIVLNQTQAGIDTWFGSTVNKTESSNVSTTEVYMMQLNQSQSDGIWTWVDFWNASLSAIYSFDPKINITVFCEDCLH